MHIVHITSSLSNGGAEAAMYRLIRYSDQNQHTVICLTGSGLYEELLIQNGSKVHTLNMQSKLFPVIPLLRMYKLLKKCEPDIVQTWMYHANLFGGVAATLSGAPKIFWGIRMSNPKTGKVGKPTQTINWICAKLGKVIPTKIVSCAHRATKEHILLGYPAEKMITISNGYDTKEIRFDESSRKSIRSKYGIQDDTILLGTIARWHPQKDHRTLFAAISESKQLRTLDWKLMLVGPEMHESNTTLKSTINEFGLSENCILMGSQHNIPAIQSALDLHVLSSADEGFPNVIAEAMACGTPCISTDAGDASVIIGDTGWVSPIQDPNALADSIDKAIIHFHNTKQWKIRTMDCVNRIENQFSIERMSERYTALWNNGTEKTA